MLEVLARLEKESASAYAKRVLEYNIIHMKLKPGEQLQERLLSEQLEISRTPIREAILELKRRNILVVYPQHGTYVSYLDSKSCEDIRYVRFVFEVALIEKACAVRDRETLDRMYENVQLQKLYIWRDSDRFLMLDNDFHEAIYRMCDYEGIFCMIRENSLHFDRMRLISYDLDTAQEVVNEHAEMVRTIENGDTMIARTLSEKHLTRAISDYDRIRSKYPQYFRQ